MSDSEKYIFNDIPKSGRIDNYLKELSKTITEQGIDIPRLEQFMFKVFNDCKTYLKEKFNLDFPNMQLTIIYKKEEYVELWKKYDKIFGTRPMRKAFCVVSKNISWIYIDFLSHFQGSQKNFIANLSVNFIEELVHSSVYPNKSETDVHELVCSAVEGFLEVKLPDAFKEARLRYARETDRCLN